MEHAEEEGRLPMPSKRTLAPCLHGEVCMLPRHCMARCEGRCCGMGRPGMRCGAVVTLVMVLGVASAWAEPCMLGGA